MKKEFNIPNINVSVFDKENVLTESGIEPVQKTAAEMADSALKEKSVTSILKLEY